ncbi:MAG: hypothetical protein OCC49_10855 [Fibrobacterales bacterium]
MSLIEYNEFWKQVHNLLETIKCENTPLDYQLYAVEEDDDLNVVVLSHYQEKLGLLKGDMVDTLPINIAYHRLMTLSHSIKSFFKVAC